jgi:hypothetical protein
MRQSKVKKIRKIVYGDEFSFRFRKYYKKPNGQIVADEKRRRYQLLKKGN